METSLCHLTAEIICQICNLIPSSKVLFLWLSGDSRLLQRLPHVRCICLTDNSPRSTSRYPRALTSFVKLEELEITRPYNTLGWQTFPAELTKLTSLQVLKLHLAEKDQLALLESNTLQKLAQLTTLELGSLSPQVTLLPNALEALPCLTHLTINRPPFDLSLLPRQLLTLEITDQHSFIQPHNEPLPPGLTSLTCRLAEFSKDVALALPRQLTKLVISAIKISLTFNGVFESLPADLVHLNLNLSYCVHVTDPTVVSFGSFLRLKSLSVTTGGYTDWNPRIDGRSFLPPRLESLFLRIFPTNPQLVLPESLTHLHLGFAPSESRFGLIYTSETLPNGEAHLRPGLPMALKVVEGSGVLHPLLHHAVGQPDSSESSATHLGADLSPSLILLTRVTVLHISHWPTPTGEISILSRFPSLVSLSISIYSESFSLVDYQALPPTLELLDLVNCPDLKESVLDHLPASMTKISLDRFPRSHAGRGVNNLTRRGFRSLARMTRLRYLYIRMAPKVEPHDFALLPDSLLDLSFCSCRELNSVLLAYLPRWITSLKLTALTIKEEHVRFLPHNLRFLSDAIFAASGNYHHMLPTTLSWVNNEYGTSTYKLLSFYDLDAFVDSRTATSPFLSGLGNRAPPKTPSVLDRLASGLSRIFKGTED